MDILRVIKSRPSAYIIIMPFNANKYPTLFREFTLSLYLSKVPYYYRIILSQ